MSWIEMYMLNESIEDEEQAPNGSKLAFAIQGHRRRAEKAEKEMRDTNSTLQMHNRMLGRTVPKTVPWVSPDQPQHPSGSLDHRLNRYAARTVKRQNDMTHLRKSALNAQRDVEKDILPHQ